MKPVPQELLQLVKQTAPPEAEVMSLPWTYEHETYNIAVVMPEPVDRSTARQIEARIIDALIDYDAAHQTFTLCMVWDKKPHIEALGAQAATSAEPQWQAHRSPPKEV
jgi:hypothetical protein